ncbi:hypothetical protein K438DRAFT_1753658 [Mycena galopus ATCC 62051]|nr:hypothetical protein K438DRAFT_1753658 [Mycena galopus ATCC 62051]
MRDGTWREKEGKGREERSNARTRKPKTRKDTTQPKNERKKEKTVSRELHIADGPPLPPAGMQHGRKEHGERIKRRTQTRTRSGSESTTSMGWGENVNDRRAHPRWSVEQACGDGDEQMRTPRTSTQTQTVRLKLRDTSRKTNTQAAGLMECGYQSRRRRKGRSGKDRTENESGPPRRTRADRMYTALNEIEWDPALVPQRRMDEAQVRTGTGTEPELEAETKAKMRKAEYGRASYTVHRHRTTSMDGCVRTSGGRRAWVASSGSEAKGNASIEFLDSGERHGTATRTRGRRDPETTSSGEKTTKRTQRGRRFDDSNVHYGGSSEQR